MHTDTATPMLPFTGRSPRSRRTSRLGAIAGAKKAPSQADRMLVRYLAFGPQTDAQQAQALGLPDARISARRAGLITAGLVVYLDDVKGAHGVLNGRYELSIKGQHVAAKLAAL